MNPNISAFDNNLPLFFICSSDPNYVQQTSTSCAGTQTDAITVNDNDDLEYAPKIDRSDDRSDDVAPVPPAPKRSARKQPSTEPSSKRITRSQTLRAKRNEAGDSSTSARTLPADQDDTHDQMLHADRNEVNNHTLIPTTSDRSAPSQPSTLQSSTRARVLHAQQNEAGDLSTRVRMMHADRNRATFRLTDYAPVPSPPERSAPTRQPATNHGVYARALHAHNPPIRQSIIHRIMEDTVRRQLRACGVVLRVKYIRFDSNRFHAQHGAILKATVEFARTLHGSVLETNNLIFP